MRDENLQIDYMPDLTDARMLLGFSGWMNGGEVSTGTITFLEESLGAKPFGRIEPDEFYIYHFPGPMELAAHFRPHARIEEGLVTEFEEPENEFFCAENQNLILFRGKEPNMRWDAYADCLFDVAENANVREIYFIGSVGGLVPHTREPVFWTSMSEEGPRESLIDAGFSPTNYDGPSSFSTYLMTRARKRGMRMASCVCAIPSYVEGRNVKCIEAITRKLVGLMDMPLDLSGLEAETTEFLRGLDKALKVNTKFAERVRQLEKFYDEEVGMEPGDDLQEWFERQDLRRD